MEETGRRVLKDRIASGLQLPLAPVRADSRLVPSGITMVAGWALVGLVAFGVVGRLVRQSVTDAGFIASFGVGSFAFALALVGFLGGAALGAVVAANRLLAVLEQDLVTWLESLSAEEGARLLPSVETTQLRSDYEIALDRMSEATVGRLPLPGFVRRFVRNRLRQHFVEDFSPIAKPSGSGRSGYEGHRPVVGGCCPARATLGSPRPQRSGRSPEALHGSMHRAPSGCPALPSSPGP